MRALRWLPVIAVLGGMALNREPLRLRGQHARIAMTRRGPMLVYADYGA
jgi:hypothetical protein